MRMNEDIGAGKKGIVGCFQRSLLYCFPLMPGTKERKKGKENTTKETFIDDLGLIPEEQKKERLAFLQQKTNKAQSPVEQDDKFVKIKHAETGQVSPHRFLRSPSFSTWHEKKDFILNAVEQRKKKETGFSS